MNVLIVDDSRIVRRVLNETIHDYFKSHEKGRLKTFQAADGDVALQCMEKEHIDIVLLDWNMPNMDGEEVVNSIRSHREWNATRIIMATTEGSKENVMKMIKKGVNGYLVKPFNEESVFSALDKVTGRMVKA